MSTTLLWAAIFLAILDWIAVATSFKPLEYIAKPGVMIVLLLWIGTQGELSGPIIWFVIGVFLSLWGDVFLMLPQERFIAGLVLFLLAHIAYIFGFSQSLPPLNLASLAVGFIITLSAVGVYRRIAQALSIRQQSRLRLPVLAYTTIISLMLFSALVTMIRPDDQWKPFPALLAGSGALLFFMSDALLAWNKFVAALSHGRLKVIIAYHLGQLGILLGAALQFLL